jgi:hypothetical protein
MYGIRKLRDLPVATAELEAENRFDVSLATGKERCCLASFVCIQILESALALSRVRSGARRSDRPADTAEEAVWRRPSYDGRVRARTRR